MKSTWELEQELHRLRALVLAYVGKHPDTVRFELELQVKGDHLREAERPGANVGS